MHVRCAPIRVAEQIQKSPCVAVQCAKHVLSPISAQALQVRNTARQQRLKLDALRHARHHQLEHAAKCIELTAGNARRQQLARTILQAQLQSLHHALTILKVSCCLLLSCPDAAMMVPMP